MHESFGWIKFKLYGPEVCLCVCVYRKMSGLFMVFAAHFPYNFLTIYIDFPYYE